MSATDRHSRELTARLAPVVTGLGCELEEVVVSRVGRRTFVRIVIDRDGDLELDDVANVSRAVEADLDADDPFSGPFVLEVSSPGVDRPLTEPRHWRRNVHRLVQVDHDGAAITARVLAATDAGVSLDAGGRRIEARYETLGPGRVQVEFNRPDAGRTPPERAAQATDDESPGS